MPFFIELRTIDPVTDQLLRYVNVSAPTKERAIEEFVKRYSLSHSPGGLTTMLETHDEFRLGDDLFTITDQDPEEVNA